MRAKATGGQRPPARPDRTADFPKDLWNSISASAAVLDQRGTIVATNPAWLAVAHAGGGSPQGYVGVNYCDVAHSAAAESAPAAQAAVGVAAVLSGQDEHFVLDYPDDRLEQGTPRWFRMHAFALTGPLRGAVVLHHDVTENKHAEWEALRHRDTLTHLQRLATLGELATSIAHELNQPLAAIMASAFTARRLAADRATCNDNAAITTIIDELLESTRRAADVVRRARALVRPDETVFERVSPNEVIADVARFLRSDLIIRQSTLRLALDPTLPDVHGNRVQLQQVLLNLLLNALDSIENQPAPRRSIVVTTHRGADDAVEICVRDSGLGIAPEIRDQLFEPFVTTKRKGTGLGLAIVRAIVHAHGGHVFADPPAEGGAAFRVVLPTV
ncbi:MAG TPA: ATP-binding protein [Gemmatimonadaceae bacterium]|jgi:C4-dicarboxylate-specific signal transduction histidine kinase